MFFGLLFFIYCPDEGTKHLRPTSTSSPPPPPFHLPFGVMSFNGKFLWSCKKIMEEASDVTNLRKTKKKRVGFIPPLLGPSSWYKVFFSRPNKVRRKMAFGLKKLALILAFFISEFFQSCFRNLSFFSRFSSSFETRRRRWRHIKTLRPALIVSRKLYLKCLSF